MAMQGNIEHSGHIRCVFHGLCLFRTDAPLVYIYCHVFNDMRRPAVPQRTANNTSFGRTFDEGSSSGT